MTKKYDQTQGRQRQLYKWKKLQDKKALERFIGHINTAEQIHL